MAKSNTKASYCFNGEIYTKKNRFCQAVVRYYADQHPEARLEDLQKVFYVSKKFPMVASREQALAIFDSAGTAGGNYFLGEGDEIDVRGGKAFVWNYFPKTYFEPFMKIVNELGYEFEVVGEADENEAPVVAEIQDNVKKLKTIQEDREVNGNYITTYGFADETGKVVIPCKYDYAGNFKDGLAMVGVDISEKFLNQGFMLRYGFIDNTGKEVIPCIYEEANGFSDGLANVWYGGRWGFIDKTGKEVIPFKYKKAERFKNGVAEVMGDDYKWVTINTDGAVLGEVEKKIEEGKKIKFFDFFLPEGGDTIYAMYDYDKEEGGFGRQITVSLEDGWRDEDTIECITDKFFELCDDDVKELVENAELTSDEWMIIVNDYKNAHTNTDDFEEVSYKGFPPSVIGNLVESIYRLRLDDWCEDNARIDFGCFDLIVDIDID